MRFQCRSEDLAAYGEYIVRFCKDQSEKLLFLKRKCERVNWNDDVFMRFADEMDECAKKIVDSLDMLSDGVKAWFISAMCPLVEEYFKTANDFPGRN